MASCKTMPRSDYKRCKDCGRHARDVGALSWTRLCGACAAVRLTENIDGIHEHDGPAFERWRRAMAASVGALLVDDLEALMPDDG